MQTSISHLFHDTSVAEGTGFRDSPDEVTESGLMEETIPLIQRHGTKVTCPICGRSFLIPTGNGRAMLEDKFLRHKDTCTIARRWEYVSVRGYATRVTRVDCRAEEFPIIEVVFPSGRRGAYRAAMVRRYPDQDAGERAFRRAKRREE